MDMRKLREILRGLGRKLSPPGNRGADDGRRSHDPSTMGPPSPGGIRSGAASGSSPDGTLCRMSLVAQLVRAVGEDAVLSEPAELRTYECDGLTGHQAVPQAVVLPR